MGFGAPLGTLQIIDSPYFPEGWTAFRDGTEVVLCGPGAKPGEVVFIRIPDYLAEFSPVARSIK